MPLKTKSNCTAAQRGHHRTPRGAERVRRLQDAAAEMFLSCGYQGVSVDRLIRRVGGSRRNVYGVYGGKQGLFVAAVGALSEEVQSQLAQLPMADADARSGLLRYGQRLLQLVLQPRMLAMHRLMVAEGQRFPEQAYALCGQGRDRAVAALGRWLDLRRQRGELRAGLDGSLLAQRFFDLVVAGPQLRALVGQLPPGWDDEGIRGHVEAAVDLFLRGAGATSAGATAQASNQGEHKP